MLNHARSIHVIIAMFSFVNISQVIGWEGWELCTSQKIGWEDRFRNDLLCFRRDVRHCSS